MLNVYPLYQKSNPEFIFCKGIKLKKNAKKQCFTLLKTKFSLDFIINQDKIQILCLFTW